MSQQSIGPARKKRLELIIAGIKRAERRIVIAGQIANCVPVNLERFFVQRPLIQHAAKLIRERGIVGHASAFMALVIKRSKLQCELEGRRFEV